MAQFYAWMHGSRGAASRLGTKASGMQVSVKSWEGQVRVRMWTDGREERDWVTVTLEPHSDRMNRGTSVTLYHGPCNGWEEYQERGELGRMAWNVEHGRKVA